MNVLFTYLFIYLKQENGYFIEFGPRRGCYYSFIYLLIYLD